MISRSNFPTVSIKDVPAALPLNDSKNRRPVVLVVDDESAIADTLSEILSRSGYASMAAYDGEEALETALVMPPEMLITDVQLPGMSGIELAITVKRVFPDCKILLFSGQASTSDLLASANRAGHQFALLSKPVHPTDLLKRIAEGLGSHKAQSAVAAM
jgi:CheY-like chemotaxis protein